MSRPGRVAVLLAAVLLAAAGCATKTDTAGGTPSAGGALKTDVGVTADTITLGVLTDRTGPFKAAGLGIEQGRTLFWNQKGKVCDRKVEFVTKDHKYSTTGASAAYAEVKDKVLALDELLGTPIIAGMLKDIEADGMPAMAASFGSDLLAHKEILLIGATYDVEMINAVGYLLKNKGLAKGDKIGHIYHEGPYGENALAGSKAVLLTTSSAQSSNALQVARAGGLDVPFVGSNPSFGAPLLAPAVKDLAAKNYVVVGSVAPFASTLPGPSKVRDGFNAAYPKEPKSAFVVFGYAQQVVLAQSLEAACKKGDLTRAGLVNAFHSLGTKVETDGLLPAMDLSRPGGIPTRQTRILKPDATVEGGLAQVQDLAADDVALTYQK